jgi:hypothetical protein
MKWTALAVHFTFQGLIALVFWLESGILQGRLRIDDAWK